MTTLLRTVTLQYTAQPLDYAQVLLFLTLSSSKTNMIFTACQADTGVRRQPEGGGSLPAKQL